MIITSEGRRDAVCRTITKADERTLAALMRIENTAHLSPWTYDTVKAVFDEGMSNFILGLYLKREQLIGYAVVGVVFDEAELLTIGFIPPMQGKGYGRILLRSAMALAGALKCSKCFLEVREHNEPAKHLYMSEGFVKVGLRKNYYEAHGSVPAEDAWTMALDIDPLKYEEIRMQGEFSEFMNLRSLLFSPNIIKF